MVTSCFGKKVCYLWDILCFCCFSCKLISFFSMCCPVAPLAVITAYPHVFASVSPTRDQLCFSIAQSAAWWMRLSVVQVRRHPWWDGPTVHYSTASSVLLPFRASLCFPLCCHTWQMANVKKSFPNILRFFLFPQRGPLRHCFEGDSFFLPFLCHPQHPSLIEPWQLVNLLLS